MTHTENLQPIGDKYLFTINAAGESITYYVLHNDMYIVLGDVVNTGFIPSFWIEKDNDFSLDIHLEVIRSMVLKYLYNDELDLLLGLIEV